MEKKTLQFADSVLGDIQNRSLKMYVVSMTAIKRKITAMVIKFGYYLSSKI
jgi:hypothetical protein